MLPPTSFSWPNTTDPVLEAYDASSALLSLEAGIADRIALCQNRRFMIFPALLWFEPTTLRLTLQFNWPGILGTLLTSVRIERRLSSPNRTSHSGAKCKRVKSRATYLSYVLRRHRRCQPPYHVPTHAGYRPTRFEPNLSNWWPAALSDWFCKCLRDYTVTRATCNRNVRNWHHRLSAVPAERPWCPLRNIRGIFAHPDRSSRWAPEAKMLGH